MLYVHIDVLDMRGMALGSNEAGSELSLELQE